MSGSFAPNSDLGDLSSQTLFFPGKTGPKRREEENINKYLIFLPGERSQDQLSPRLHRKTVLYHRRNYFSPSFLFKYTKSESYIAKGGKCCPLMRFVLHFPSKSLECTCLLSDSILFRSAPRSVRNSCSSQALTPFLYVRCRGH